MTAPEPLRDLLPNGLPANAVRHGLLHFWEMNDGQLAQRYAAGRLLLQPASACSLEAGYRTKIAPRLSNHGQLVPSLFGGPDVSVNTSIHPHLKLRPRNAYDAVLARWEELLSGKGTVSVFIAEAADKTGSELYRRVLTCGGPPGMEIRDELLFSNCSQAQLGRGGRTITQVDGFNLYLAPHHGSSPSRLNALLAHTLLSHPQDQASFSLSSLQAFAPPRERPDMPPGDPVRAFQIHAEKLRGRYGEGVEPTYLDNLIARTMAAKGWKEQDIAHAVALKRTNPAIQTPEDVAQYSQSIAARAAAQAQQTKEAVRRSGLHKDSGRER